MTDEIILQERSKKISVHEHESLEKYEYLLDGAMKTYTKHAHFCNVSTLVKSLLNQDHTA